MPHIINGGTNNNVQTALNVATPSALAGLSTLGAYASGQNAFVTAARSGGRSAVYVLQPAVSSTPDNYYVVATADDVSKQWVMSNLTSQNTIWNWSVEIDLTQVQTLILFPPLNGPKITQSTALSWFVTQRDGTITTNPTVSVGASATFDDWVSASVQTNLGTTTVGNRLTFVGSTTPGNTIWDISARGLKLKITSGAVLGSATVFKAIASQSLIIT